MKKSLMKKNVVKKNLIRKVLLTILLFLPALLLAGCVGEEEKTMIDLRFDEGDSLALRQGWYLEDKSCLLYGDYVGAKGRQGRLYWLDKPGEEPVCIWPLAGGWFDLDDELLAYYLPEPQTVVLSNQTRQQFLLVDVTPGKTFATPQGNRQEIALPKVRARGDLDLCLWLGEGRYLLGRSVYGQEEEPLAVQLSHFDENTGADMPLAELPGRICDVKVDVERNRLLVLSNLGGLGVLDLSDMSKFHMLSCNCAEAWPTPSPFNEYLGVWPVQAADGGYLVPTAACWRLTATLFIWRNMSRGKQWQTHSPRPGITPCCFMILTETPASRLCWAADIQSACRRETGIFRSGLGRPAALSNQTARKCSGSAGNM